MTTPHIQNAFSAGEISPSLYGRTDLGKYNQGASTARNFFINYRGGASSRAGGAYVGTCKQPATGAPPRDIPFQFNINQGYALEFGDQYMRIKSNGAYVTEASKVVTGVSSSAVFTTSAVHGFVAGDWVYNTGNTGFSGLTWIVATVPTTSTFTVTNLFGDAISSATVSGAGTVARIYTVIAPYAAIDLPYLKFTQSADVMSLTCVNQQTLVEYPTYELTRRGATNWTFAVPTFTADITAPRAVTATAQSSTTINTWYSYVVTAVSATGEESVASDAAYVENNDIAINAGSNTISWAPVSGAVSYNIYKATPSYNVQLPVGSLYGFAGRATGSNFIDNNITADFTAVPPVHTDPFARSAITAVTPIAGGSGLSQATIGYTLTTSTGSGFAGVPVVYGDYLSSFIIQNGGKGYASTDTITFGTKATGTYTFTGNPTNGQTIILNGTTWTFVTGTPSGNQTKIHSTVALTLANLVTDLDSSVVVAISVADYSLSGLILTILYKVIGTGGNAYTLAAGTYGGTISAGTLTGGTTGAGSAAATGTITFNATPANPAQGNTLILNGVTWTFGHGYSGADTSSEIGGTLDETLTNFIANANASNDSSINLASYSYVGAVVTVTYKTAGTVGNAYTIAAGSYAATVSGATLTGGSGGGAAATLTIGDATGTYPSAVAYYQQRRAYANTIQEPDTYFFSKPGAFLNMDSSIPVTASDAFTGAPWAQQVNGIQALVAMPNGLIVLTGKGAWLLNGGGDNVAITASSQTAIAQAYNGCHSHIQPIVINYDVLYVQSKGSIVRDLSYNFFSNIYTGTDTTVLSNHLFNFHQLQQWAYAEEPYKLVWAVRDDGIMLSLTYLKEQDVYAWARHDTNGFFVGACSIVEPPVDAVYLITKRYIQGHDKWMYYSERMDNRNWENAEDCFCVDAGLSYAKTYPSATLTPAAADGTNNITSVDVTIGGSGYTAPTISVVDPLNTGSGATFSVTLSGGIITAINVLTAGEDYAQGSTLIISDATGDGAIAQPIITNYVTFTASGAVFDSGMVGDVIRIGNNNAAVPSSFSIAAGGGGKAVIVTYNSTTEVIANIIEPITNIITDDPTDMPAPVASNQWSIAVPTTSVTGLNHLEGMEVAILADGSVVENQTVTNGAITLPNAASSIAVGLPYICQLQTLYLDVQTAGGTIQGKRKTIPAVTVRVEKSRGLEVGSNQPDQSAQPNNATVPWTNMKQIKERNANIHAGNAVPLYTGDERILIPSNWDKRGQVAVQQRFPLKADVLAVVPEIMMGDV